jgi:hypothetical protein
VRTLHETAWELFVRRDVAGIAPALRRSVVAVHFLDTSISDITIPTSIDIKGVQTWL